MASKKARIYVSQMRKAVREYEHEMETPRACTLQQELLIALEQVSHRLQQSLQHAAANDVVRACRRKHQTHAAAQ
jgi:hypothetical protein